MIRRIELATSTATPASDADDPAAYPQSWYLICRSRDVRAGQVISRDFLGSPIVIFRGASGAVHALAAHCAHMGAHLGTGTVVGEQLRCGLHHWQWDGNGACRGRFGEPCDGESRNDNGDGNGDGGCVPPPRHPRQAALPVAERFGVIFIFNGPRPLFDPPAFTGAADAGGYRCAVGRAVAVACPWEALVANGFDVQHLEAVHGRALRQPAEVERLDDFRLQLRYVSRVTGRGIADRAMKWISGDAIRVSVTCWGGAVVAVASEAGRSRSELLLGIMPTGRDGVSVTPVFAVRRDAGFALARRLRLAVTRWLFTSFMTKDVGVLAHMRWSPRPDAAPEARPLMEMLAFLSSLPRRSPTGNNDDDRHC